MAGSHQVNTADMDTTGVSQNRGPPFGCFERATKIGKQQTWGLGEGGRKYPTLSKALFGHGSKSGTREHPNPH